MKIHNEYWAHENAMERKIRHSMMENLLNDEPNDDYDICNENVT